MGDSDNEGLTFGKWLRQKRRALDLTQEAFASQVGCARITLRRIESGELKPSKEMALILLEKAGITEHEREAWLPFTRGQIDLPTKQTNPFPPVFRNNLPAPLTNFIGREKELRDIIQLIAKNRLVTLTGSGGVGKTRLSIQGASELLSEYPMGVWLVELAPLTNPVLTYYLHSKKILLVLDNCEHVIDACAQLCVSLLRSCPDLKILTSSREALDILGEQTYRVPSLSLPDSKSILNIIQESEAVMLFLERAKASRFDFELTEFNASFVVQICRRLDGIALAIELAASRVKMFKVEQIAERLNNVFDLLTVGNRTALPRQQTLRALIDWSYTLLSEEEKTFLRRLSVFMGGWTLEAAESVCGNTGAHDLLTRLVDKSLVIVDHERGDEVRYYLLETIRQYAREKLVEVEDLIHLQDLHLDYFLKTAERIAPELYTRKMPNRLDYLEIEYANFQIALKSAQECDIEAGLHLCNALFRLWQNRGEYRKEGLDWVITFLGLSESIRSVSRVWALYHAALLASLLSKAWVSQEIKDWLDEGLLLARSLNQHICIARLLEEQGFHEYFVRSDFDKARELLDHSIAQSRLVKDDLGLGFSLDWLGRIAYEEADYFKARLLMDESVSILNKAGELRRLGLVLTEMGNILLAQGDWTGAQKYYEQSLSVAQEARSRMHISFSLGDLGKISLGLGDFNKAFILFSQAQELVQGTPDDKLLLFFSLYLGEIARFQGNFDQAIAFYNEYLTLVQADGQKVIANCVLADIYRLRSQTEDARKYFIKVLPLIKTEGTKNFVIPYISYFALDQQKTTQAASLFGWTDNWRKTKGFIALPMYQSVFNRYLTQARDQLSESEFNAAWAEGQSMSQEQVLALVMEVLQ